MENISVSNQYFSTPRDINICNIDYKNIMDMRTCKYTDQFNKPCESYTLGTSDATYTVYITDGKFSTSVKDYHSPTKRTFDGVTYNNIISNRLLPNGNKIYDSVSKYGYEKTIIVSPENHVLNKKSTLLEILAKNMRNIRKHLNIL